LVAKEVAHYPVTLMCHALGLPRSSYYRWKTHQTAPPPPRLQRHAALTRAIVAKFADTGQRAGRRPIRQLLAADGIHCAAGTVHTIMAEQHLIARRTHAWKRTTVRDPAARTAHIGNHCLDTDQQRCFHSDRPGTMTVGDITSLPTREGWLYLAVVLDLATRAVIGWALRPTQHTELVIAALSMAHQHGHLAPGAIFHSDRGSQYTSQAFQDRCAELTVVQSMGQTGVCWDNAVAESFFATLKSDLVAEVGTFATRQEARAWVVRYIEGWYNRRRPHSTNHGVAPMTAWERLTAQSPVSLS
jgi:transposase InsO family protein